MADGVRKAFVKLFESEGKMKEKEAQQLFNDLLNDGRYHEDVFGIVHK
jgi:sulfite reductase alpha subunit-like flavoprotein